MLRSWCETSIRRWLMRRAPDRGRARRRCAQSMISNILMNTMERITITITPEMAQALRGAVEAGEYASSSEIIREALRDWRHKRALQEQELADLRAKIEEGLADIAAGRVRDFDAERIIRQGRSAITRARRLCLTASAEEDLVEIWSFIAQDNREAASKLIREIEGRFATVQEHPEIGLAPGPPGGGLACALSSRLRAVRPVDGDRSHHRARGAWRAGCACRALSSRRDPFRNGAGSQAL